MSKKSELKDLVVAAPMKENRLDKKIGYVEPGKQSDSLLLTTYAWIIRKNKA